MAKDTDWAWAAGFFEGEGSFSIGRQGKKKPGQFGGWVQMSQKHPEPLLFLQEILEDYAPFHEVTTMCNGVRFGSFQLNISSLNGTRFLKKVLPYMHHPEKIAKAKIYVRMFAEEGRQGVKLSEERVAVREDAWKDWLELQAEIRGDL